MNHPDTLIISDSLGVTVDTNTLYLPTEGGLTGRLADVAMESIDGQKVTDGSVVDIAACMGYAAAGIVFAEGPKEHFVEPQSDPGLLVLERRPDTELYPDWALTALIGARDDSTQLPLSLAANGLMRPRVVSGIDQTHKAALASMHNRYQDEELLESLVALLINNSFISENERCGTLDIRTQQRMQAVYNDFNTGTFLSEVSRAVMAIHEAEARQDREKVKERVLTAAMHDKSLQILTDPNSSSHHAFASLGIVDLSSPVAREYYASKLRTNDDAASDDDGYLNDYNGKYYYDMFPASDGIILPPTYVHLPFTDDEPLRIQPGSFHIIDPVPDVPYTGFKSLQDLSITMAGNQPHSVGEQPFPIPAVISFNEDPSTIKADGTSHEVLVMNPATTPYALGQEYYHRYTIDHSLEVDLTLTSLLRGQLRASSAPKFAYIKPGTDKMTYFPIYPGQTTNVAGTHFTETHGRVRIETPASDHTYSVTVPMEHSR